MMRLKAFGVIVTLALGLLAAPLPGEAQKAETASRIGFLAHRPLPLHESFWQGLRERGWVEGQNFIIERRWAQGRNERFPDLAAELVGLKVDAVVAVTSAATRAAMRATATIPIIMVAVGDPVTSGFVASLARPGGNVTGLSFLAGLEIEGKRLQLLKEVVPQATRVAVLVNRSNPIHPPIIAQELPVVAERLKVRLQILDVRGPGELEGAFEAATRERAEALLVFADPLTFIHRTRIAALAANNRLPAMYLLRANVEAGGLMSYGVDLEDHFRLAATYVDTILRGANPAHLPVQQPMKFDLTINLKIANALGLTIPPSLLFQADRVI
ncbi:MAG: ABC transporter substrate-binding protein, partial [Candidatus Methylomirabilia bacterium]